MVRSAVASGKWLALIAIVVVSSFLFLSSADAALKLREGQSAEQFGLKRLFKGKGRSFVYVDDYIGPRARKPAKALIIGFFASWCKPCRREIPLLNRIYEDYKDKGLAMIMVNIDKEEEGIKAAREYLESRKPDFPVVSDKHNIVARRYFEEYFNLPATFLVTPDLTIRKIIKGADEESIAALETTIRKMLGLSDEKKELPVSDNWEPSDIEIAAKVYKAKGSYAWIKAGKKEDDNIEEDMDCRYETIKGKKGSCKVLKTKKRKAKIKADGKLKKGDKVYLSPSEF